MTSTAADPLPSWNDGPAKQGILAFIAKVTKEGSPDFLPLAERIAVHDNDGTLWPENPMPFQAAFAIDELNRRILTEPKLASDPMVQAALAGDFAKLLEGEHFDGLMHVLALTHAGMTIDEFRDAVEAWFASAKHPRYGRPYDELTYQPMQELLRHLRANGFKNFIVSGGGADFMRVWVERVYGIPPEQVVGSTARTTFELRDSGPVLTKTLDHLFVNDKEGKPVGIHQFIGRRPTVCCGNSDGDHAMLQYTTINNPRPSFGLIVHHTDSEREYAYDAKTKSTGKLVEALEEAPKRGWLVVDMKQDWNAIFGPSRGHSWKGDARFTTVRREIYVEFTCRCIGHCIRCSLCAVWLSHFPYFSADLRRNYRLHFGSHCRCTRLSDCSTGRCGHPCDLVRQRSLPVLECNDRHCWSDSWVWPGYCRSRGPVAFSHLYPHCWSVW